MFRDQDQDCKSHCRLRCGPDPIIAQPVQCGIDLGDQIGCVDHFGGGVIQFSTVNLERAVEVERIWP